MLLLYRVRLKYNSLQTKSIHIARSYISIFNFEGIITPVDMKNVILFALLSLTATLSFAGFHCPDDISINCDMDVHNTDMTGYPNTTGFNVGYPISYTDLDITNGCGVGQVNRTWYQDLNNNQILDGDDPSCTQVITVEYLENDLFDINWPPNRDLSCLSDIAFEAPQIVHGPCDLVGYVWEDQVFELTNEACYKILRTFSVINWCTYDENNPALGGLYTYTQVIKVTEKELPEFTDCQDITIAMDEGCKANVTISSAAMDIGDCPSEELYWTVEIDLGWDLIIDYEYSYLLTGDRYLAPTANGEALSITLPDLVDGGTHGALYTVKDGCGNVRSCQQRIYVEDQKAPTPYCHSFLTAAFDADAMPAMIPAELFNIGATDNCTDTENIRISFSADPDDNIKEITCGSQGFQFFNIWATDEAGNADFCEVFMLIFDNDGCSFRYGPMGTVQDIRGEAMEGVNVYLTDGVDAMYQTASAELGDFQFDDVELVSDYYVMTDVSNEQIIQPTILDLKRLQNYMIGLTSFDAAYQYVAADVNRDRSINPFDVVALRDHIIGVKTLDNAAFSAYVEAESLEQSWREYRTEVSYMNYDGSFDLVHIGLQDMQIEAEESIQNLLVDQVVSANNTMMTLTNDDAMTSEGIELTVVLPKGLSMEHITLTSSILDISSNQYHYNSETGILKYIALHTIEIGANTPWMTIALNLEVGLVDDISVNWISDDVLIRSEVQDQSTLDIEDQLIAEDGLLISNVVSDMILLRENISLGQLNIYDMRGLLVYTAINNDNRIDASSISQGMYIIQWTNGLVSREAKFVKK